MLPHMTRLKWIVVWLLQILLAVVMIGPGVDKFTSPAWERMFRRWGYPDHFYLIIGAIEVVAGLALLVPRLASAGAIVLIPVMIAAALTQMTPDNYVTLHASGHAHLLRETLGRLEKDLDPDRFVRIHRSAIVQVDRIRELRPAFHGDFTVVLRDGTRLTLSRGYRAKVEQTIGRAL